MDSKALQQIRGAVARGWTTEGNTGKEMGATLAEAISLQVLAWFSSQQLQLTPQLLESVRQGLPGVAADPDMGNVFGSFTIIPVPETADGYQIASRRFASFDVKESNYSLFAIVEELGELFRLMAKRERGDEAYQLSEESLRAKVISEMGDVMWNVTRILDKFGVSLAEVFVYNLDKLETRYRENKIKGDGDDR